MGVLSRVLPLNVYHDFWDREKSEELVNEGRVITLEYQKFYLVTVYKPNAGGELVRLPYRSRFDETFNNYVSHLNLHKPSIVVGDFNVAPEPIDLSNPVQNKGSAGFTLEERKWFKDLLSRGMVDSFRYLYPKAEQQYTWWSNRANSRNRNIGWRIDHILVDERLKGGIQEVKHMKEVMGSDHCPIQLVLNLDKVKAM